MATTNPPLPQSINLDITRRADNLALIFQEVFTVIVRLRANRQRVTDPDVFRNQIKKALKSVEDDATRRGYSVEDVRVGTFAVVAFLDESILNSHNPMFGDWQGKPLQNELFGIDIAGEIFYRNVERLLARNNSEPLADLLEVHQLCLLLGFRGRYSASRTNAEVRAITTQIEEKIKRIRGTQQPLAWQPSAQTLAAAGDKWIPILRWVAVGCVVLALLLFLFYKVSLSSSASHFSDTAAQAGR
jgi:type VI secretion system protein ImpK